ncbi:MAG: Uma2 family endonuclease [bacterium]|nr:Uma2 family endonuclease [bacterium]
MAIPQPQIRQTLTRSAFEDFVRRPENQERGWELIDGEAVEKMPSNPYSSWIALKILNALMNYMREHQIGGYLTGESAGYSVGEQVLSPDGAYTTEALVSEGFQPNPPKLALEVVSPTDKSADIRRKLVKYMDAGVLVWVIYPREKVVDVWSPNALPQTKGVDDVLTLPDLLPGFSIPVREIVEA